MFANATISLGNAATILKGSLLGKATTKIFSRKSSLGIATTQLPSGRTLRKAQAFRTNPDLAVALGPHKPNKPEMSRCIRSARLQRRSYYTSPLISTPVKCLSDTLASPPSPRRFKRKVLPQNYQLEADDSDLSTGLTNLIMNLAPTSWKNSLHIVTLSSLLYSLIVSVIVTSKTKSKLAATLIMSNLIGLVSAILTFCHIETEYLAPTVAMLRELATIDLDDPLLHPEVLNTSFRKGFFNKYTEDPNELMLLRYLVTVSPITSRVIIDAHADLRSHGKNVILPASQAPSNNPFGIRQQKEDFRYPDWFLKTFWNISDHEMISLRQKSAQISWEVSDSYEDLGDINAIEDYVRGSTAKFRENPEPQPSTSYKFENPFLSESEEETTTGSRKIDPTKYDTEDASSIHRIVILVIAKVVGILIYLGDCIFCGTKLTMTGLVRSLAQAKQLIEESKDVEEMYATMTGKLSPTAQIHKKLASTSEEFNDFMAVPTYVFARDPLKVHAMKKKCKEFELWYSGLSKEMRTEAQPCHALYTVVNSRIHFYFQNEINAFSRQEPFVVLIKGTGGIGKTQFMKHLARKVCQDILRCDPKDSIAEITPEDKYWPPFGGQPVAIFDDVACSHDISKDLLLGNLKGICSPVMFNAASADVNHKINPINFKIIFATMNTEWKTLSDRIGEAQDVTAIEPYFRRMICIEASWNEKAGTHDPSAPWLNKYDKKNFTHLKMQLVKVQGGIKKDIKPVSVDTLLDMIKQREAHLSRDFTRWLHTVNSTTQSNDAKSHFSIMLHGRAGQGKTTLVNRAALDLSKSLFLPYVHCTSFDSLKQLKFKSRTVLVLDDIIRPNITSDEENELMDLYNNRLPDHSIIISTTNVTPTYTIPVFSGLVAHPQRKVPFRNEGLIRRFGYSGYFGGAVTPATGYEIFVSNMRYYFNVGTRCFTVNSYFRGILFILFVLLQVYIMYIPVFTLFLIFMYVQMSWKEIPFEDITKEFHSKYVNYLDGHRALKVEYVNSIPPAEDYTLEIQCENSKDFMNERSLSEIDARISTDRSHFYSLVKNWKLFLLPEVLREMHGNHERYRLETFNFTEGSIINLIKRYQAAFRMVNIKPIMKATFGDIGEFEFRDGILKINRNAVDSSAGTPITYPSMHVIADKINVLFRTKWFTVSQLKGFNSYDIMQSGLSMADSIILNEFISSDTFNCHPMVRAEVIELAKQKQIELIQNFTKINLDRAKRFLQTPLGIVVAILVALLSLTAFITLICKAFKSSDSHDPERRKQKNKGNPKTRSYDTDDDTHDTERRKNRNKGNPKARSYDTDDDKHEPERRKHKNKGNPKARSYDTDDDRDHVTEDVLTLKDMNNFSAYAPYYEHAHRAARKNLCMVYLSAESVPVLEKEPLAQACYGLFICDRMVVTVGHILNEGLNVYIGKDGVKGFHLCHKVCAPKTQDLSVFHVPTLPNSVPDISKLFLSHKLYDEDQTWNIIFERFSPGKKEEMNCGEMNFYLGPTVFPANKALTDWAAAKFGTWGIKVTAGGDCGLPYYFGEPHPILSNKLVGIHCMGNTEGSETSGIVSVISTEDIMNWKNIMKRSLNMPQSLCCQYGGTTLRCYDDDKPKVPGQQTVWHAEHMATWSTFLEELKFYLKLNPNFRGRILKHAGKLHGSVDHSHTQFLPEAPDNGLDVSPFTTIDLSTICTTLSGDGQRLVTNLPESSIGTFVSRNRIFGGDFRLDITRSPNKTNTDNILKITLVILPTSLSEFKSQIKENHFLNFVEEGSDDTFVAFPSEYGNPIHVHPAVERVLSGATRNLERGKLEDVPFRSIKDNQTVKVRGVFGSTKSHTPSSHYKLSPFSKAVEPFIPIEKKPAVYDLVCIPHEEQEKFVKNNFGIPCQRSTLTVAWAHPVVTNPLEISRIGKMFEPKIATHYQGMRLLTDSEVLHGINNPKDELHGHLAPMELDTSIGFTMKELFYVQKKADVLAKDENGAYTWKNNLAADFLRSEFQNAKILSSEGKKYCTVFNELLKMEKLKIAKMYRGRTFVAQDVLGVLMERRNLGILCARAAARDPTCGIGSDPVKTFNQIYNRLNKHPNLWAGDYKNFDRNTPAHVQLEISKILQKYNPKIANEIKSTMLTNVERLQVSGTTLFEVYGGMPSGCFTTAPLNSLNNEFLMFACFVLLCEQRDLEASWKIYESNVERMFYGDDVIVSVSDEYKDVFTRKNVSEILLSHFGMILDSSAKDGSEAVFDTYDTASWISRFFRKCGKYPFFVGALKKISIGANFHYTSDLSLPHLGQLMERAQWEAAFWDEEYFNTIQSAIRVCIEQQPKLLRYVDLRLQSSIHEEAKEMALPTMFTVPQRPHQPNQIESVEERHSPLPNLSSCSANAVVPLTQKLKPIKRFFAEYSFPQSYHHRVIKVIRENPDITLEQLASSLKTIKMFSQTLNNAFTGNKCTKPTITFTNSGPDNDKRWTCTITVFRVPNTCANDLLVGQCVATSKQEAKEGASYQVVYQLGLITLKHREYLRTNPEASFVNLNNERHQFNCVWSDPDALEGPDTCPCHKIQRVAPVPKEAIDEDQLQKIVETAVRKTLQKMKIDPNNFVCEMNVAPQVVNKVPQAPMTATDVSVVSDSGLYTNTAGPSPTKIINSLGIALDNPAGTGAPFNKHVSCYNIFQRWSEKNTTISPSMTSGTEILRISLDPNTLPEMIKSYVSFHESIVPAIEVLIAIAGAAGTIGWITTGWVRDASKPSYTLNDLQQVSMEESNLNGTQVIRILLNDVRKTGLYRSTVGDTEPYPGIVMLVDHAVTNVQRNDSVNYPVRVQVRLAPNCVLMEPFATSSVNPTNLSFNLGSYFYDDNLDMLIGSSSTTDDAENTETYEDCGYMTKDFVPVFGSNVVGIVYNSLLRSTSTATIVLSPDESITPAYLAQCATMTPQPTLVDNTRTFPSKIIFGYGKVPSLSKFAWINEEPTLLGSSYTVNATIQFGMINYKITTIIAQSEGCYVVAEADVSKVGSGTLDFLVYNNIPRQIPTAAQLDFLKFTGEYSAAQLPVIYQDVNHLNVAVGDDYTVGFPIVAGDFASTGVSMRTESKLPSDLLTFVQTGNTMPGQNLPTGLKQLSFVRIGTTTTVATDVPFVPLYKPMLRNAFAALDKLLVENGIEVAKANLYVDEVNKGEVAYQNSTLLVRTDDFKKILARTGSAIMLRDIVPFTNPQGLAAFNTTGLSSWISTSVQTTRRRIDPSKFVCQASIAGGLVSGLGSGISTWANQMFQEQMMNKVLNANSALQGANNAALAQRQKDAFERNLELTGYNSSSAQFGLIGPRPENHMDVRPYQQMQQRFEHVETLNPYVSRPSQSQPQNSAAPEPKKKDELSDFLNPIDNLPTNGDVLKHMPLDQSKYTQSALDFMAQVHAAANDTPSQKDDVQEIHPFQQVLSKNPIKYAELVTQAGVSQNSESEK